MGKKISQLVSQPIYTYLYGLAFLIFKSSAYFGSFEPFFALAFIGSFVILNYLLIKCVNWLMGNEFANLICLIIWMSIFHVVGIAQALGFPFAYIPLSFYLFFYLTILVSLTLLGITLFKKSYPIIVSNIINVFLGMTVCIFSLSGIKAWLNTKEETIQHQHQVITQNMDARKEIVWILMDEYGSSLSLEQQMGFHNPFDSVLTQRGFQVYNQVKTRYSNTLFSVYSIFNQDDSIKPSSYYEGIDLLRKSSLVPTLEKEGYRFVNLGFFDISEHPMLADRSGYPYTYLQQIISGTLLGMIHNKWKNSIAKCDAYNQEVLQRLDDSLGAKSLQKRFIWAHITIPHEPFCRDSVGKIQKEKSYHASDSEFIKAQYLSYLQYGNKRIVQLLDKHPEYKDKIIIISGDHGPRYPFLLDKKWQLNPFLAIYTPKALVLKDKNSFSYLSNLPLSLL